MTDEDKLHKDAADGTRAKALLEDELLIGAFQKLEEAYVQRWRTTHLNDAQGREKLFIAINVVGKVQQHLASIVADGSVAKKQLDELAKKRRT